MLNILSSFILIVFCSFVSVTSALAQCGADGTQPCRTTPNSAAAKPSKAKSASKPITNKISLRKKAAPNKAVTSKRTPTLLKKNNLPEIGIDVEVDQDGSLVEISKIQNGVEVNVYSTTIDDSNEIIRITPFEPGNYLVKISKDGFFENVQSVTITNTKSATVNINLRPITNVSTVVDNTKHTENEVTEENVKAQLAEVNACLAEKDAQIVEISRLSTPYGNSKENVEKLPVVLQDAIKCTDQGLEIKSLDAEYRTQFFARKAEYEARKTKPEEIIDRTKLQICANDGTTQLNNINQLLISAWKRGDKETANVQLNLLETVALLGKKCNYLYQGLENNSYEEITTLQRNMEALNNLLKVIEEKRKTLAQPQ